MRRLWVVASVLIARLAFAQDNKEERSRTVEVVIVGSTNETGSLVDTIRELLGRLGLVPNVHAVGKIEDADKIVRGSAVARVEIDLRSDKETSIAFDTKQGPRRRTLRRDPSSSIAREELAHAIQTVVEAQLFPDAEHRAPDPKPELEREPEREPKPDIAPPPPPPPIVADPAPGIQHDALPPVTKSPWAMDVSVLGGGAGFSDNSGPVARLGAGIAIVRRRGFSPSLGLDVSYMLPFDAQGKHVAAHTSDLAFRAMAGVQLAHTSWLGVHAGAGAGVDVMFVDPTSRTLGASAILPGTTRASPILSAALGADVAIVSPVVLTLRVLTDFDVGDTLHYVDRTNNNEVILSPWHARPSVMMGFTFTPFGQAELAKK